MATDFTTTAVDQLNSLLQGELSALETYRQVLENIEDAKVKQVLKDCHMCHSKRVDTLVEKIVSLGGRPSENSGVWGAFAKMMEGGAKLFGDKAAIAMLEEGEDRGLSEYKKMVADPDMIVRELASDLISSQENTHEKMRNLKLLVN
ncbi:MAG: DUF2383 domain-containing protein [Candidatus Melainabacteria bacterium]|jgi:uncharacterized protein (TIGR02284 family)|nr:DUF2383 domain-containing protein [Candidatus Melainabacteria bacterium]